MRRKESHFASPQVLKTAGHLASLVKQARLARGWSQAALAERARISAPTMHRIERGAVETSLGAWLAVLECLGLLSRLTDIRDPASAALLDETRTKRPVRKSSVADLDF
jgi:transcriptional regulator with XRE-family HTH domain